MITTNFIIGLAFFIAIGIAIYVQIPAEDPEILEARKRYGKVE
jgi:hypothetical protein